MSYIGTEPKDIRSFGRTKFDYTATQGQTAFTGADGDGKVLAFTVGQIEVYVNGILMDDSDFSTTGTGTVTLATAANLNDVVNVVSFETNIPDSNYVPATGGTFTGDVDFGANKITYANLYAQLSDLPSASTYHGMFAHVHATGLAYYAHAGAWIPLASGVGIDDNADATAITIDNSERVLVGKTASNYATEGVELRSNEVLITKAGQNPLSVRNNGSGGLISFNSAGTSVGTIGANGSNLYIGSSEGTDAHIGFGNNIVRPVTSAGAARDNAISLGYTGMRFKDIYLSGGIYMQGSTTASQFDDYEEGTFTASFSGATVSVSSNAGIYTKIGNMVYWRYYTGVSTISSSSGALIMGGLPFNVANIHGNYSGVNVGINNFFGSSVTDGQKAYHQINHDYLYFVNPSTISSPNAVNGSSKYLMIGGFYQAA
jgi:hypothetical protein